MSRLCFKGKAVESRELRIMYARGYNNGLCHFCKKLNYTLSKEGVCIDEVIGKREFCKSCSTKTQLLDESFVTKGGKL